MSTWSSKASMKRSLSGVPVSSYMTERQNIRVKAFGTTKAYVRKNPLSQRLDPMRRDAGVPRGEVALPVDVISAARTYSATRPNILTRTSQVSDTVITRPTRRSNEVSKSLSTEHMYATAPMNKSLNEQTVGMKDVKEGSSLGVMLPKRQLPPMRLTRRKLSTNQRNQNRHRPPINKAKVYIGEAKANKSTFAEGSRRLSNKKTKPAFCLDQETLISSNLPQGVSFMKEKSRILLQTKSVDSSDSMASSIEPAYRSTMGGEEGQGWPVVNITNNSTYILPTVTMDNENEFLNEDDKYRAEYALTAGTGADTCRNSIHMLELSAELTKLQKSQSRRKMSFESRNIRKKLCGKQLTVNIPGIDELMMTPINSPCGSPVSDEPDSGHEASDENTSTPRGYGSLGSSKSSSSTEKEKTKKHIPLKRRNPSVPKRISIGENVFMETSMQFKNQRPQSSGKQSLYEFNKHRAESMRRGSIRMTTSAITTISSDGALSARSSIGSMVDIHSTSSRSILKEDKGRGGIRFVGPGSSIKCRSKKTKLTGESAKSQSRVKKITIGNLNSESSHRDSFLPNAGMDTLLSKGIIHEEVSDLSNRMDKAKLVHSIHERLGSAALSPAVPPPSIASPAFDGQSDRSQSPLHTITESLKYTGMGRYTEDDNGSRDHRGDDGRSSGSSYSQEKRSSKQRRRSSLSKLCKVDKSETIMEETSCRDTQFEPDDDAIDPHHYSCHIPVQIEYDDDEDLDHKQCSMPYNKGVADLGLMWDSKASTPALLDPLDLDQSRPQSSTSSSTLNVENDDLMSLPGSPFQLYSRRRRSSSIDSAMSRPGSDLLEVPLFALTAKDRLPCNDSPADSPIASPTPSFTSEEFHSGGENLQQQIIHRISGPMIEIPVTPCVSPEVTTTVEPTTSAPPAEKGDPLGAALAPQVSLTTDDGDDFAVWFGRRGSIFIEEKGESPQVVSQTTTNEHGQVSLAIPSLK